MKTLRNWIISLLVTVIFFYIMDHGIMSMQGLPLNIDMTPAQ